MRWMAHDFAYARYDAPIGRLTLAATATGLAAIAFGDGDGLLAELAGLGARVQERPERLDPVRHELDEYFAGARETFTVPLDWCLTTGFRRTAQQAIARVPYGRTATYAEIAAAAGRAGATRAAGTACRTNPIPVVVPCHRVLRSDGSIGGYAGDMAGGLDIKRHLLALEGVQLSLAVL
jgi:methylated-DNA-[protein]-cysteine S-methyltransferase